MSNLRSSDLKGLIEPVLQIDTYTPKVKDDSIVVLFNVKLNFDAAYDLSSFIEKLPYGVIDTEAQDIPDVEGNYNVFVEFERDNKFPENLMLVLRDVMKLAEEIPFSGNFYDAEGTPLLDEKVVRENTRLAKVKEIKEFMEFSTSKVLLEDRAIAVKSTAFRYNTLYGVVREIYENEVQQLLKGNWEVPAAEQNCIFGQLYEVYKTPKGVIVTHNNKTYLFK